MTGDGDPTAHERQVAILEHVTPGHCDALRRTATPMWERVRVASAHGWAGSHAHV